MTSITSFISKRNLISYYWLLFFLSITITYTYAHGLDNDDDESVGKTPSVFASDNQGTLAKGNIGLGFGLTVMAALASALGSLTPFLDLLFPFIPFLAHVKITESKGFRAGSLSFASGVLLFLTLGDLFPEAVESFKKSNLFDKKYSYLVAVSIFTLTIMIIIVSKMLFKKYKKQDETNSTDTKIDDDDDLVKRRTSESNAENDLTDVKVATGSKEEHHSMDSARLKSLSIQISVALALHKIPEGLIIALPIYYATGSRWIAFAISATVGIVSQMLGALLGYLLFVTIWNDAVSGVLFSIVTASLIYAILHGMLPMARHYDPKDKYVTNYTFIGLIFFGLVASIFEFA
ncbi:5302_t:CDS:2 [Funneliformis geosporum]|nr:5302_t:CDS:2 [Funneliformis geosporum]